MNAGAQHFEKVDTLNAFFSATRLPAGGRCICEQGPSASSGLGACSGFGACSASGSCDGGKRQRRLSLQQPAGGGSLSAAHRPTRCEGRCGGLPHPSRGLQLPPGQSLTPEQVRMGLETDTNADRNFL